MKVYSIGREAGCDIVINDHSDVVSRRHAILNVSSSGKMTITDQSHNGTYVNGMRISSNVAVPVTRKDSISFAHVARLNWDMVPKTTSTLNVILIIVLAIIGIAICSAGGYFAYKHYTANNDNTVTINTSNETINVEDIRKEFNDSIVREKARQDSISKAKNDSIKKVNIRKKQLSEQKKKEQKSENKKEKQTRIR